MKTSVIILSLIASWLTYTAVAQSAQPILRIEIGMHSGTGKRISSDAAAKYILTCSNDKTARLWNAATGKLLNILRVPIGNNNEGKIYSCALSPDGKKAALGGWTGYEWDNSQSVYIVDIQTGELETRLKNIPAIVSELEFSPDGKWLAAGTGGSNGVYIYDAKTWTLNKHLEGYGGVVYNLAFGKDNKLATVCYDKKIRIYNNRFEQTAVAEGTTGKIYSVSFHPSGNLIAVGYEDSSVVEVRNTSDLSVAYRPTTPVSKNGEFDIVTFSSDGAYLYGGGSFSKKGADGITKRVIRIWEDGGKGSYTDMPQVQNSILDLKAMPNGNIAIMGAYPDVAVSDPKGIKIWYQQAENVDYRDKDKSHFRINDTGNALGFKPFGQNPMGFDVLTRSISENLAAYPAPATAAKGVLITQWNNGSFPVINDNKVKFLEQYENSHCADITSDGRRVVIGADWNIYLCAANGDKLWKTTLPATAWAINIAGNDNVVVAALGDGTIRWYSMADGKELLAFYLNSDKKRWVLFTPQGYYDASAGAEDFIGWHINNGKDKKPSFYPASRFRDVYYRPDIIDAIFETFDENQAIALANKRNNKSVVQRNITEKLPPTITITSPASGSNVSSSTVKISYAINTPTDAPVKNVKVLVNGRPVATERGLKVLPSNNYTLSVTIPEGNSTITLLADNDNGMSPEANLSLSYVATAKAADEFVKKPKLYVLAFGISAYNNPDYKLAYADADAQAFVGAMQKQKGLLYDDVIAKTYTNKDATRENMQEGLQWIQDQTTQHDIAMIFYAGHGINDNNGIFYMLPVGADVTKIRSTCLNFEELKQTASSIAGKVVVFIDACHSGNVMGGGGRRAVADINELVNELSGTQNGAVTFTSSTGKEYSLEDPEWKHGAFTTALLEGLSGKGSIPGKNKITVKSLDAYISERVKELTKGKQHPTSVVPPNVPDFTIGTGQ